MIAPDAEFDYSALLPDGPVVRGVEAWDEHADSSPWGGSLKLASERIFDVDDERVLVFVYSSGEGEGSGAAVEGRTATEFTIRDGVIVRIKLYKDRTEALESRRAVGVGDVEENVEIVRRFFKSYRPDDPVEALAYLAPDVVYEVGQEVPARGRDEVAAMWERWRRLPGAR